MKLTTSEPSWFCLTQFLWVNSESNERDESFLKIKINWTLKKKEPDVWDEITCKYNNEK